MDKQFFQGFGLKMEGGTVVLFGFGVGMHYLNLPYSIGGIVMILAAIFQVVYIPIFIYYEIKKAKRENWIL